VTSVAAAIPALESGRGGALASRLDEAAFTAFYEAVAPRLWKYLFFACRDRAAADDLTQETFARVLAARLTPESDEHLTRYLFKTATHLLRDRHRRPIPATAPLEEWDAPTASAEPGPRIDLERALASLRPKERQLLFLAHVEALDHRAIAELVGARAASVRVLLFRARRRLAAALELGPEARERRAT
jgi:RNA polymerase sigma-70 factor (ECF subfamily)